MIKTIYEEKEIFTTYQIFIISKYKLVPHLTACPKLEETAQDH